MADSKKTKKGVAENDSKKKSSKKSEQKKNNNKTDKKSEQMTVEKVDKKPFAYHLVPYVFALLAIFFTLCFITNAIYNPNNILNGGMESEHALGTVGFYVCEISMGLLGPGAYALPVLMLLFVVFWKNYDRRSFVSLNIVILILSVALVSAFSHIVIKAGGGINGFATDVSWLYDEGAMLKGGGVIGGYIGYALYAALNVAGSIFVIVAVLIPMLLFLFGTTPVEAVQWLCDRIKRNARRNAERRAAHREARKIALEKVREEKAQKAEEERKRREEADKNSPFPADDFFTNVFTVPEEKKPEETSETETENSDTPSENEENK